MDSIQLLARKGATCSELLGCLYSLKPMELEIFFELARQGESTLDGMALEVKRERSTVHRALSKLVSAGLVYKRTRSLKDGGYFHVYATVDPSKIREQSELMVKEVTIGLQRLVDSFESDFKRQLRTKVSQ